MLSNRCLGTTVTSSISHRKATSEGTSPGGRRRAMVDGTATDRRVWSRTDARTLEFGLTSDSPSFNIPSGRSVQ